MSDESFYLNARNAMVRDQIAARGLRDARVLEALRTVPRHLFVSEPQRPGAYEDMPLPIGHGQTISQPYIVAFMTEALQIRPGEKVLEVGTGSGYQAAVLAALGARVYSVEIIPELAEFARANLSAAGFASVEVMTGDGSRGWPEKAPFDAVIVTCAPDEVPTALKEQIKDGGRMAIPVGPEDEAQELVLLRRKGGEWIRKDLAPVRFVPMIRGKEK